MYKTLLRPIITYACPVWRQAAKIHIKKLQIFQNKVLRLITNSPRFTPIRILNREANTELIQEFMDTAATKFYDSTRNHNNPLVAGLGNYDPTHYKHRRPKTLLGQQ